ncbi:hypothetical protein THRCLA_22093 [Thraustotheca clavata]|uniref:ATPase AAA-type core domain-containing protein n=1 Tax=Thraustotheca clavata TaxID=74557 RepID=A0A1V9ZCJ6_9STRA|nr:hypothetical protein THRCLA_22093 [Thraustotheca clavata]
MRGVARWLQQTTIGPVIAEEEDTIASETDDEEFVDGKKRRRQETGKKATKMKTKSKETKGQMRLDTFCPPKEAKDNEIDKKNKLVHVVTLDESVDDIQMLVESPEKKNAIKTSKRKPETLVLSTQETQSNGRPKRRAVVNTETRKECIEIVENADKKTKAKRAKKNDDDIECWTMDNTSQKKKKTPPTAFFMTAQEKEEMKKHEALVREQETLLKFQTDMEKRKALDMAFYAGKTAVNPFFQKANPTCKNPIVVDGDDVPKSTIKWVKELPMYPPGFMWHVNRLPPTEHTPLPLPIKLKANDSVVYDLADVEELTPAPWNVFRQQNALSRLHEQVDNSVLWIHSNIPAPESSGLNPSQIGRWTNAVRNAKKDPALLSVDRFSPSSFNGVVGSKESVVALYEWLRAWKLLRSGKKPERSSFYDFFIDPEDSDEDEEDAELYRLLVVKGEAGAGKTCSVYACAAELGYQVLELNAGQQRSGKQLLELAGEATQSNRVVAGTLPTPSKGPMVDMSRVLEEDFDIRASSKKKEQKKKKKQKSKKQHEDFSMQGASLSLVLLEDASHFMINFNKGFLNAMSQMAKYSKCPIIATCTELPENFTSSPPYLLRQWRRPTSHEFEAYLQLINTQEAWGLPTNAFGRMHSLFHGDLRRALHFLDFHHPTLKAQIWAASNIIYRPLSKISKPIPTKLIDLADDDNTMDLTEDNDPERILLASSYLSPELDVLHALYLSEWTHHYTKKAPPAPLSWADNERPSAEQVAQMESIAALADVVSDTDLWTGYPSEDAIDERKRLISRAVRDQACEINFLKELSTNASTIDSLDQCMYYTARSKKIESDSLELYGLMDDLDISIEPVKGSRVCGDKRKGALDVIPYLQHLAVVDSTSKQSRRRSLRYYTKTNRILMRK